MARLWCRGRVRRDVRAGRTSGHGRGRSSRVTATATLLCMGWHRFRHPVVGPTGLLWGKPCGSLRAALPMRTATVLGTPFLPPGEMRNALPRRNGRGDRAMPLPRTAGWIDRLGGRFAVAKKAQAVPLGRTRTNIAAGNLPPTYVSISTPINHSFAASWRVARVQWKGQ